MWLFYAKDAAHGYVLLREKLSKAMRPGSCGNCAALFLFIPVSCWKPGRGPGGTGDRGWTGAQVEKRPRVLGNPRAARDPRFGRLDFGEIWHRP